MTKVEVLNSNEPRIVMKLAFLQLHIDISRISLAFIVVCIVSIISHLINGLRRIIIHTLESSLISQKPPGRENHNTTLLPCNGREH